MIVLGIILLIIGFVAGIAILWTIGIIVLVIGLALALLGMAGGKTSRRRWLMGIFAGVFLVVLGLSASCGSTPPTSTTTGTPAGQYTVLISATSGSAVRSATVQMVVQ